MRRLFFAIALFAAACGGSSDPDANPGQDSKESQVPTTASSVPAPTSTVAASTAPLDSYRFVMTLAVEPEGGEPMVVGALRGERTLATGATHLTGTIGSETIDLVSEGASWWDLAEPDLEVSAQDVELFLATNGFLQPTDIAGLLADGAPWDDVGTELHLGSPTTHLRRTGIVKDADWEFGDVAQLDVWREGNGDIVKLVARWATGDNSGFPITTWEITERNPDLTIPIPDSG